MPRVIVVGCGVAGTVVANQLVRTRAGLDVRVFDYHGDHVYQPGSLGVAFGRLDPESLRRDARHLLERSVRLERRRVERVDVEGGRIELADGGSEPYDALVIATGSRADHQGGPPGLREGSLHYHCPRAAASVAQALAAFEGGRIVVGAVRLPYKCPPSPIEFSLLLDETLRLRGLRDRSTITYVYPIDRVQPDTEASPWAARLLGEHGIEVRVPFEIESVDPEGRRLRSVTGETLDYDLLALVPPHRGADFLVGSPLATGPAGWVRVDPRTLRVAGGVYALGDAADLPVPKSGSAARVQARIVVDNLLAELEGKALSEYSGRATFLVETGARRASRIDSDYVRPPRARRPNKVDFVLRRAIERFYFPLLSRT